MTPASSARNLAVFIDADNLNDPTALDHILTAVRSLADRIVIRRAYGRAESLRGIESVLWRHGVRPVANLIVDKTTTDSALVIDAVEAVCRNRVDVVAICSGDADFVPLAMWLREHHCHVLCYSLSHKIFSNPESFYDEVVLIDVVSDMAPILDTPSAIEPAPLAQTPVASKATSGASEPKSKPEPAPSTTAQKPKAPPGTAAKPTPTVKAILQTLPLLKIQQTMHLSVAAKLLREAGLLSKTGSSTALFRRYPAQFELLPAKQPNSVRYRG